jgi:hypothetical protein
MAIRVSGKCNVSGKLTFGVSLPVIGTLYQGAGYVISLDSVNRTGVMISTDNLEYYPWEPSNAPDISTGIGNPGSGYPTISPETTKNATNQIISAYAGYNNDYAAYIARNHNGGGFNDWYLPLLQDIEIITCTTGLQATLNANGANIPSSFGAGAIYSIAYENSSSFVSNWISDPAFYTCNSFPSAGDKSNARRVRPVRFFSY